MNAEPLSPEEVYWRDGLPFTREGQIEHSRQHRDEPSEHTLSGLCPVATRIVAVERAARRASDAPGSIGEAMSIETLTDLTHRFLVALRDIAALEGSDEDWHVVGERAFGIAHRAIDPYGVLTGDMERARAYEARIREDARRASDAQVAGRFVATSWRDAVMASETLRATGMSHPLAMVLAALDGERDPSRLGLPEDQYEAFRASLSVGPQPATGSLDVDRLAKALIESDLIRRYQDYATRLPTMRPESGPYLAREWAAAIAAEYTRLGEPT